MASPALLVQDKIDRYRPFGAFGKPVYQSHVQLRAMLRAKRGERFADYFAKPTYDPDTGELRWTAHAAGAARGWHQMSADEQARHALDLEVIRSGLVGFVQELRAQGGAETGGAAAFASLLEQAMQVPPGRLPVLRRRAAGDRVLGLREPGGRQRGPGTACSTRAAAGRSGLQPGAAFAFAFAGRAAGARARARAPTLVAVAAARPAGTGVAGRAVLRPAGLRRRAAGGATGAGGVAARARRIRTRARGFGAGTGHLRARAGSVGARAGSVGARAGSVGARAGGTAS